MSGRSGPVAYRTIPACSPPPLVARDAGPVAAGLRWRWPGLAEPSSLRVFVEHPKGAAAKGGAGRVGIAVISEGSRLLTTSGYAWEPWQEVAWNERKKAGF